MRYIGRLVCEGHKFSRLSQKQKLVVISNDKFTLNIKA